MMHITEGGLETSRTNIFHIILYSCTRFLRKCAASTRPPTRLRTTRHSYKSLRRRAVAC